MVSKFLVSWLSPGKCQDESHSSSFNSCIANYTDETDERRVMIQEPGIDGQTLTEMLYCYIFSSFALSHHGHKIQQILFHDDGFRA